MRRIFIVLLLLVTAALLCVLGPAGSLWSAGLSPQEPAGNEECLAVIVNRSNPLENISFGDLRKIFLGERTRWPDGHRITVVMQEPGQPERKTVLKQIYRMSESDFNRYFLQGTFTGEVFSPPKTLATSVGVRKFVFNVPGAIGYMRAQDVDETVKVIRIDGHLPAENGYKIRLDAW